VPEPPRSPDTAARTAPEQRTPPSPTPIPAPFPPLPEPPRSPETAARPAPELRAQVLPSNPRQTLQRLLDGGTPAEIYEFGRVLLEAGNQFDGFEAMDGARRRGDKDALLQFGRWYDPRYQNSDMRYFRPDLLLALRYYTQSVNSGSREAKTELEGLCAYIRANRIDIRSMSVEAPTNLPEACRF
jgi:hypothetical protein